MELTRVIIKPLHTEKTYLMANQDIKTYSFIVDKNATKLDIKIAFESIYGFLPTSIRTQIRKPVWIRTGTAKPGMTKLQKIAHITLPKGKDIATSQEDLESKKEATK